MLVMKIIFNVLIAYLVICTVISIIRTVGAKREEWHVYNGQGMSFNHACGCSVATLAELFL